MIRPNVRPASGAVARHYDELDRFYRDLWGENLHHGLWLRGDEEPTEATENLTRLVAERGGIARGDRVCDVGCGYGGPARTLAEVYGARVVGVTLSEAQGRHMTRHRAPDAGVACVLGDWMDNPFAAGRFDAVIAIESLSHMPDPEAFFRECRRVLRPSGRLVVAAWLARERPTAWQAQHLLEPICAEGRLYGLGARSEYLRMIEAAELRMVGYDDLTAGVRRTWSVCARRALRRLVLDADARRYLMDGSNSERVFAAALGRIWLAYRTGALRYGVFTAIAGCGDVPQRRRASSITARRDPSVAGAVR